MRKNTAYPPDMLCIPLLHDSKQMLMQHFFGQDLVMCAVGTVIDDDTIDDDDETTEQACMPNETQEVAADAKPELKRHILFPEDCDRQGWPRQIRQHVAFVAPLEDFQSIVGDPN